MFTKRYEMRCFYRKLLILLFTGFIFSFSYSNAQVWVNGGPWSNYLRWISYSPFDTTIVWGVEKAEGQIWKSTDSGVHWNEDAVSVPSDMNYVGQLVFHPSSPEIIFLFGSTLYRSSDGATTWNNVGSDVIEGRIYCFVFNPDDCDICFVGTSNGFIYRSTDGGIQWEQVFESETGVDIGAIAFDPQNSNRLISWSDDFIESINNGDTWRVLTNGAGFTFVSDMQIDSNDPNIIYVYGTYLGISSGWFLFNYDEMNVVPTFLSDWNEYSVIGTGEWSNANGVFYGIKDNQIWKSVDYTDSWYRLFEDFPLITGTSYGSTDCLFAPNPSNPQSILLSNRRGTFHGNEYTDEFHLIGEREGSSSITRILSNPADEDGFVVLHEPNGMWTWSPETQEIDNVVIEYLYDVVHWPGEDNTVLAVGENLTRWNLYDNSFDVVLPQYQIAHYQTAFIPANEPNRIIFSTNNPRGTVGYRFVGIYQAGDPTFTLVLEESIRSIVSLSSGPSTIFAGGHGFYRSLDSGTTWTAIDPDLLVRRIIPHEASNSLFLLLSGYSDSTLFRYNAGEMFVDLSASYPDTSIVDLVMAGNRLYAISKSSVYTSDDLGESWSTFSVPFTSRLRSICVSGNERYLAIGTEKDRIWAIELESGVDAIYGIDKETNYDIYPNPFNSTLNISFATSNINKYEISIYNTIGQRVVYRKYNNGNVGNCGLYGCSIDMSSFSSGIYIVGVNSEKRTHFKKVSLIR